MDGGPAAAAAAAAGPLDNRDARNALKAQYVDFLDQRYRDRIGKTLDQGRKRVVVDINDIRGFEPALAQGLLRSPVDHMLALEAAAKEVAATLDPASFGKKDAELHVGVDGDFGAHSVSPRGLNAPLISSLVSVEGIITKCSLVHPKAVRSAHYCAATGQVIQREYPDLASDRTGPLAWPTKDENDNPLTTLYGLCKFRNTQTLAMQELPELAPAGQLPRSVDIIVEDDLVDSVKPGDRVRVVGMFRAVAGGGSGGTASGVFRTVLLANFVRPLTRDVLAASVTEKDMRNIRQLAKRGNLMEVLVGSMAPAVYGHERVKEAMLLQLLGGVEKTVGTGTHLRGDINILLVGDPSTAKSQMLRFAMRVAPLAISTTGRGATGVGLTAAVTSDRETGERRLEAGAMVLADRGLVCIDEFDKMSDADRTAMHEVMEQQTVTIQKAGVHTTLNARCAVLAAANPVFGQYNSARAPADNIGLPDSLLSRFDLLFITLDSSDAEVDRAVAMHVLRMHRYERARGAAGAGDLGIGSSSADAGDSSSDDDADGAAGESQMYERNFKLFQPDSRGRDVLSCAFLRKYIHYARTNVHPELSEGACDTIAETYADLRNGSDEGYRNLPLTARTLETLIRLATAYAKARLSPVVSARDAESAADLLRTALFAKRAPRPKRRLADDDGPGADVGGNADKRVNEGTATAPEQRPAATTTTAAAAATDEMDAAPSREAVDAFARATMRYFAEHRAEEVHEDTLLAFANRGGRSFARSEMRAALAQLQEQNRVMRTEDGNVLRL